MSNVFDISKYNTTGFGSISLFYHKPLWQFVSPSDLPILIQLFQRNETAAEGRIV